MPSSSDSSRSTGYALAKYAFENGSVATRYFTLHGAPAMSAHDSPKSTSIVVLCRALHNTTYVDPRVMLSLEGKADPGRLLPASWTRCTLHNPYRESSQSRMSLES